MTSVYITDPSEVGTSEWSALSASMDSRTARAYRQVLMLGFAAGLRSMTPLALLSLMRGRHPQSEVVLEGGSPVPQNPLDLPAVKIASGLLALGELAADKLPVVPSRLQKGPFIGRLVIGGVAGAILCRRARQPMFVGAAVGALGAALGAATGATVRSIMPVATDTPDFVWAGLEDLCALALGLQAIKGNSQL